MSTAKGAHDAWCLTRSWFPFIIYLRVCSIFADKELPHSLLPLNRSPLFHMLELIWLLPTEGWLAFSSALFSSSCAAVYYSTHTPFGQVWVSEDCWALELSFVSNPLLGCVSYPPTSGAWKLFSPHSHQQSSRWLSYVWYSKKPKKEEATAS